MRETVLAVFITMGMIFSLAVLAMSLGPLADKFQYKMGEKFGFEGTPVYPKAMESSNQMFKWFYSVPAFFSLLMFAWLFKVLVWKHIYTTQDSGNYDYKI